MLAHKLWSFYACPQALEDCCVADEELHKILYYDCDSFDPIDKKTGKPFFYLLKHRNGAKLVKKDKPPIRRPSCLPTSFGLFMLAHKLWSFMLAYKLNGYN
jgi:hypothetical protein